MILHIFVIHKPNFEENGRTFVVSMNRQTFYIPKREEEKDKERRIKD